jgi:hypothetical protein
MTMTAPTLPELLEQRAAIESQIAALSIDAVNAAREALGKPAVQTLLTAVTTARDALPNGQAKDQINNVIVVLTAVPDFLNEESERLTALLPTEE